MDGDKLVELKLLDHINYYKSGLGDMPKILFAPLLWTTTKLSAILKYNSKQTSKMAACNFITDA